jgi:hypothetical protein
MKITGHTPQPLDIMRIRNWKRCKGFKGKCGKHIQSKPHYPEKRQELCATCYQDYLNF